MNRHGIILFAHGARDPAWARPFEATAHALKARAAHSAASGQASTEVALAFLEFMQPDLLTAGTSLAQLGCQQVSVVPLFLGAGGHVRKDLPRLLAELEDAHPQVSWTLCAAVGETELLIQALADSAWQLANPTGGPPQDRT